MSDASEQDAASQAEHAAQRQSIGRYLAAQRRLRGITLDELAERTRIPRRNLERLESGAFDGQLDGFVRGFVRTVAEALGLDPREAVLRLVGEPVAVDEDWLSRRRLALVLAAVAIAAALVLGLSWGLRQTVRWIAEPSPAVRDELIYRRDAVRALAEERPASTAPAPPPAIDDERPAPDAAATVEGGAADVEE